MHKGYVCISVYLWKHFKAKCALTKSSKQKKKRKKNTLRKRNDVLTHNIKLIEERKGRVEAGSMANAGLVRVLKYELMECCSGTSLGVV